jgi:peptidylprolyl isomerase
MRVGGRRQLIIPPALAYGETGGHRLSGKTLIFVIDLLDA